MLIAATLAAATVTLTDRARVTLTAPVVRVGDVAAGGGPVARIVIARLSDGREVVLSRRAMAALIRRAVPGIVVAGTERGGPIALRAPGPAPRANPAPARLPEPPAVQTGDSLTLVSRAGPVMVERPVTALQPGRDGRRLFVRDAAGQVSSIQFVGKSKP